MKLDNTDVCLAVDNDCEGNLDRTVPGADTSNHLTHKAPITTAANDTFCDIFSNFQKKNKA